MARGSSSSRSATRSRPRGRRRPFFGAIPPGRSSRRDRLMPLYGGRRFAAWNTIEGPAPVRRGGRYYCGYSGGNYTGAYGTGEAVADSPLGPYHDLRGRDGPIFGTTPGLVEGPGHFSVVRPDLVHDWIVLHGRVPGEPVRRVWLCPASWGSEGVTIGGLTNRPQPAPPLAKVHRFADGDRSGLGVLGRRLVGRPRGPATRGPRHVRLRLEARRRPVGRLGGRGLCGVPSVSRTGRGGGLSFRSGARELSVLIDPEGGGQARLKVDNEFQPPIPLPTLGDDPFHPAGFHAVEVRTKSGRAEVRVDGVRIASDLDVPPDPVRPIFHAVGTVLFDALSVTLIR